MLKKKSLLSWGRVNSKVYQRWTLACISTSPCSVVWNVPSVSMRQLKGIPLQTKFQMPPPNNRGSWFHQSHRHLSVVFLWISNYSPKSGWNTALYQTVYHFNSDGSYLESLLGWLSCLPHCVTREFQWFQILTVWCRKQEIVYFPKIDGPLQIEEATHVHKTVAYCKVVCCYSHQQEFHAGMNKRRYTRKSEIHKNANVSQMQYRFIERIYDFSAPFEGLWVDE